MNHWWRAYDEAVDDPKLILLSDKQHRAWFNLCCVCSQYGGMLPTIDIVAIKLRTTPAKAKAVIAELAALRLVDFASDDTTTMHNWTSWQYKTDNTDPTTALRSKRYRDRKRDADRDADRDAPVSVTPTRVQSTDTDSEAYASAAEAAPQLPIGDMDVVDEDPKARLFRLGKPILMSFGIAEKRTGTLIGQWLKAKPDPLGLLAALQFARDQNVAEPIAYVSAIMHSKAKNGGGDGHEFDRRPGESLGDLARRMAAAAREHERKLASTTSPGRADEPG